MEQFPVSVIIPAFNEACRLPPTLEQLLSFFPDSEFDAEIIVVNDGSTDTTEEVCRTYATQYENISYTSLEQNRGKGAALAAGVARAQKEWVLLYDADGATPIEELLKFKEFWKQGDQVLIGSRDLPKSERLQAQPFLRHLMGRAFVKVRKWTIGLRDLEDTQCGFKLLPRLLAQTLFQDLQVPGFLFDVEILARAQVLKVPIREVGIRWSDVPKTKVNLLRELFRLPMSLWKIRQSRKGVAQSPRGLITKN